MGAVGVDVDDAVLVAEDRRARLEAGDLDRPVLLGQAAERDRADDPGQGGDGDDDEDEQDAGECPDQPHDNLSPPKSWPSDSLPDGAASRQAGRTVPRPRSTARRRIASPNTRSPGRRRGG